MRAKVYASPYAQPRTHRIERREDEIETLAVDWNAVLAEAGSSVTISASTWETDNGTVAALSSSANSGGVSTVNATFNAYGCCRVSNLMTMSNGEKRIQQFHITVKAQPVSS